MSRIKVNSIANRLDDGPPEFPNSAIVPDGGTIVLNGNLNVGVATVGLITATDINATTINASGGFSGDGSGLTGLPIASQSKVIALKRILGYDEYRA
jgi:hypothetical protein